MALVTTGFETLVSQNRVDENLSLRELAERSRDMARNWKNRVVFNDERRNFGINEDLQLVYHSVHGEDREVDITDTAFAQLCTRLGVPAKYVKKCMDNGKTDLALSNFHAWADDCKSGMLIREYDGVARAVLSDSYEPFDSNKILRALSYTVDTGRYVPTQIHLSPDRLHIRFVDYTPLPTGDSSPLYAGFIVDSSDVGRGSLNMKFFLYRSVCKNGMAISKLGGTLFRQSHIGEKMTDSKIAVFNRALSDMGELSKMAVKLVGENNKKMLKDYELKLYLERAKREMKLSEAATEKLNNLVTTTYEPTMWGLINGVTELAQDFTLDTRVDMESWAGNLFTESA